MTISSILVATDASPASKRAVALAADLAARYDATLHLLHVVRDMQLPPEIKRLAEVEHIAGARREVLDMVAERILEEAKQRAEKKGAGDVRTTVGHGDPANTIVRHARRLNVTLVVLGTRGLGKVKGAILGSVSRKVTNLSDINCLVVH